MRRPRFLLLAMTLVAGTLLAARRPAAPPDPTWLTWNSQSRTATFKLIAGLTGRGAKSPFNFNGYTDGDLTLVVPESSTVVMNFVNDDGTPHSAEVIWDSIPVPNMAGNPAIPRAYTKQAVEGIAQFGTDVVRFRAVPAGRYRVFCGVPGHGLSGMWIRLKVSPGLDAPMMAEAGGS